jgi:hypothetical protein
MNQYDAIIEHYSRRAPDAPTTQYKEVIECCTRIATKSCDVATACFVENWLRLAPALGYEATTPEELAIQMGYVGYKPSLARRREENRRHCETMKILLDRDPGPSCGQSANISLHWTGARRIDGDGKSVFARMMFTSESFWPTSNSRGCQQRRLVLDELASGFRKKTLLKVLPTRSGKCLSPRTKS